MAYLSAIGVDIARSTDGETRMGTDEGRATQMGAAVLVEISDEWESGNVYLNMTAEGGAA